MKIVCSVWSCRCSVLLCFLTLMMTTAAAQDDDRGCAVLPADADKDFFPVKVQPVESKNWAVSYHQTYKIVQNLATNATYLLYQCGTDPPATTTREYNEVIEIPISKVGVEQTVTLPFLEQLGRLDAISLFLTDPSFISSPCFLQRVKAGQVLVASDANQQANLLEQAQKQQQQPAAQAADPTATSDSLLATLEEMVAFVSPFSASLPFAHAVQVAAYTETTNAAIFEWIYYYSLFFNLEDIAQQVVQAAADRFECVAQNAARIETDTYGQQPVVLWGYYSGYCQGWDNADCPNYYCELASSCATTILEGGGGTLQACGGLSFKTLDEFIEFGKDADYWFYPADNWNATFEQFGNELQQIKAVRNQKVYDYQGAGPNAWFQERYASYYDVLQDFCSVVGTTHALPAGRGGWFRNVFTEPVGGLDAECTANDKHSILPYNFECDATEFNIGTTPTTSEDDSANANSNGDDGTPSDEHSDNKNNESAAGGSYSLLLLPQHQANSMVVVVATMAISWLFFN